METGRPKRKIRLGIAKCLLGERVRYDGGHKLDRYLKDVLGTYVEWVPVCPEVECGMGIPREAVRLVGVPEDCRLVGRKSGEDWTDRMKNWGMQRIEDLERAGICGYVFKFGSPSSGMNRIKVYRKGGGPSMDGVGVWAAMVMDRFPGLPFEDEGRLNNPAIRENFISRVFTLKRWRTAMSGGVAPGRLVEFHSRHKMLVMAHNVELYRALGKIVARVGAKDIDRVFPEYFTLLLKALSYKATVKKHANVLMHAVGYFKKNLDSDEKQELLEIIDQYRNELLPLSVPMTLINHFVRKYGKKYLAEQYYLYPYPAELMLRNHV